MPKAFVTPSPHRPTGVCFRPIAPEDSAFLAELYASCREREMAQVDWSSEQKEAFLLDQFRKQHAHYVQNYPGADLFVIRMGSLPIGRVYVCRTAKEIRLMDIALVARARGCGLGTALLRELVDEANATLAQITLHVEPGNPAHRLYERLGFSVLENRGVYDFMGYEPAQARAVVASRS